MARVLITDGEQRAALAIVRSLGRAGHHCIVCSADGRSLAGASRHAAQDVPIPEPGPRPVEHGDTIADLVAAEGIDLLIPVTEAALLSLLPVRDRMACVIPFPSLAAVQSICDKAAVLRAAEAVGIRVPRQVTALDAHAPAPELALPVVLKPARSVYTGADGRRGRAGVRWARTPGEFRAGLRAFPAAAFPVLVQEAVEGPGIGVFVLVNEGTVLARFAHRRLREKPPSGGVSVLRRSEPLDPALLERSLALLERFGWSGVAMVEYKRDHQTGEMVLMEINGRFWGSLQLAIDAGVDFPRLLADVSFGNDVSPVTSYGRACSRWLLGDVDHLISRLRYGSGLRDRAGALGAFLGAFMSGCRTEVLRWSDPRPFFRESVRWLQDIVR